ncbi:protein IQ-DOMAIN 19-like [Rhododendron vialii]|uniref:protein IQ-DOMAIN 19-like n=1 Tax=Rhododendron vialii TaxID=182163 RepID=UPI00265ED08A|nr:protein IQ-DOMAIN 19-like [Rhododendron vialii]
MGKTKKWIKNFFTGKEDKQKKPSSQAYSLTVSEIFTSSASVGNPVLPPESPKEKQGLSSRRSPPPVPTVQPADHAVLESRIEQKKAVAVAVVAATAKLVGAVAYRRGRAVEEAAAVVIQSVFRSYLARKALKALRGLVKVQALVRGYLVRKQTTATLHCMQSLATAQARARSQWIRMADESNSSYGIQSNHRKAMDGRSKKSIYQEIDRGMDGNIRIVEMDVGESKRSTNSRKSHSSHPQTAHTNHRTSKGSMTNRAHSKQERRDLSAKPSALVDSSPRARSMRFDDYYFDTAQSSPQYSSAASVSEYPSYAQTYHRVVDSSPRAESRRFDDYYLDTAQSSPHASSASSKPSYPSYHYNMMAPAYVTNTESPRAKGVRSQSATWARPDSTAGMSSRKKAPRAGTRPDSKVDPWLAKHARVGGSTGKERDLGSSRTGHTNTVNGKSRSPWK